MLGKLVNKFKRQTLQDGAASPPGQLSPPASARDGATRRSARLNEKAERAATGGPTAGAGTNPTASPSPPQTRARRAQLAEERKRETNNGGHITAMMMGPPPPMCCAADSGTESDDDELEMLDSLSNASLRSLSHGATMMPEEEDEEEDYLEDAIIGRSPPTLTSSPPLVSEIDTSSWDSCGCESGIVLRDSAERDDASRNVDLLEAAFGGGELVIDPHRARRADPTDTTGTTPVQSKDAFPAHFRAVAPPLPIDFSALRHSELLLLNGTSAAEEDVPTPIGSQKTSGQGAALMEAHLGAQQGKTSASANSNNGIVVGPFSSGLEQQPLQGAFRRVLRRTRRNSQNNNNVPPPQQQNVAATAAARTISPPLGGIGLGEKRRWGDAPEQQQQHQNNAPPAIFSSSPIAARTRGSLMGALMNGLQQQQLEQNGADLPRPVLTAARRTRVRVLYSAQQDHHHQQQQQQQKGPLGGRRAQVAPILGQSPPNMMLANKRGRHCSKSSSSPPRPSLNFDKMRKRMLGGGGGGPSAGGADAGPGGAPGDESGLD